MLEFDTNHMKFAAATVTAVYKQGSWIALFFKALKQSLRVKTFVRTSADALSQFGQQRGQRKPLHYDSSEVFYRAGQLRNDQSCLCSFRVTFNPPAIDGTPLLGTCLMAVR